MYFIVFVGPAGSGKSHLVDAFGDWLEYNELSAVRVNLDPAAEWLPYEPDVDARNYVEARDVMVKYKLGPNGALIASVDLLVNHVDRIREEIENYKANYVLVDTPGQMELLAFRQTGPEVVRSLVEGYRVVSVFLIDSVFASRPSSLASSLFLALAVRARLRLPQVIAISKADLLNRDRMEYVEAMLRDPAFFHQELLKEDVEYSVADALLRSLEAMMPEESRIEELLKFVSAVSGYGLEDLYAVLQQVLAGGEDFLTEEPNPRL